jgi:hypothetical protein
VRGPKALWTSSSRISSLATAFARAAPTSNRLLTRSQDDSVWLFQWCRLVQYYRESGFR